VARTTAEKRPAEPGESAEPQAGETTPEGAGAEQAASEKTAVEAAPGETASGEDEDVRTEGEDARTAGERADAGEAGGERADGESGGERADAGDGADEETADAEAAEETPRRRLSRISDPLLLVATVLVVVAAACAGYFGWSWYSAAHDDSLAYSRTRDDVLRAAEQGVQNMNTLDYRKVDQGLASWEASSTGDLHQQLVQGRAQFSQQVRAAKTVTTAKILDAAVTELDDRAGKAGAIVAVQITVTPPTGSPATKQSRMRAQLTRTRSGWKLSALGQAPLGTTAG
jgi:Mce-associated membrane protein